MSRKKSSEFGELFRTVFYAILIALVVRTVAYEPFNIPSGSMIPTLLVGDYLFVSKYSYGYSRYSLPLGLPVIPGRIMDEEPERGDVAVFKLPGQESVDYIKRVIGLPGDTIQMRSGHLYINGQQVPRDYVGDFSYRDDRGNVYTQRKYRETLPNGNSYDVLIISDTYHSSNTPEFVVPEGHYFMMGDNRNNSIDSRFPQVGFVPYVNLVGRAEVLFFATDGSARIWEVWKWPSALRWERFFQSLRVEQAPEPAPPAQTAP